MSHWPTRICAIENWGCSLDYIHGNTPIENHHSQSSIGWPHIILLFHPDQLTDFLSINLLTFCLFFPNSSFFSPNEILWRVEKRLFKPLFLSLIHLINRSTSRSPKLFSRNIGTSSLCFLALFSHILVSFLRIVVLSFLAYRKRTLSFSHWNADPTLSENHSESVMISRTREAPLSFDSHHEIAQFDADVTYHTASESYPVSVLLVLWTVYIILIVFSLA